MYLWYVFELREALRDCDFPAREVWSNLERRGRRR
jgi:hypothetical protein